MSRGWATGYGFAVVGVLLAGVFVAAGNLILTFHGNEVRAAGT